MPILVETVSTDDVPVDPSEWRAWISTDVSYQLNNIAATFDIQMTNIGRCEEFGDRQFPLHPQTPVRLYAVDERGENRTLVLTGHVEVDNPIQGANDLVVQVAGRSLGGDLIDCSHVRDANEGWLWQNQTILQIAQDVASRFGGVFSPVEITSDLDFDPIEEYRATIGDTAFEILDVLARREGVLLAAQPDGSIRLQRASRERVGFMLNCSMSTEAVHDYTKRYSQYFARGQRHRFDGEAPQNAADVRASTEDTAIGRYRPRLIQPEGSVTDEDALRRVQWQRARDRGDGLRLQMTVPGFFDPNGNIWRVNTRVWVESEYHNINQELLIAGVSFRSDSVQCDITSLILKPVAAYEVEPRTRARLSRAISADADDFSGFELNG